MPTLVFRRKCRNLGEYSGPLFDQAVEKKKATNIVWHPGYVAQEDFEQRNGHRAAVLWFTGLSGSGKSTIARATEWLLFRQEKQVYVLDGDNIRHGLNQDLDFSPEGRQENIRRIGEVAQLFRAHGSIVLTAFISPYRADRQRVRERIGAGFHEVYIDTPLETCKQRDPKGLYAKAIAGEISNFTGISAPYEAPPAPELHLRTQGKTVEACAEEVLAYLGRAGVI